MIFPRKYADFLHSEKDFPDEFFYNYQPSNAAAIEAGRGDSKLIQSLVEG